MALQSRWVAAGAIVAAGFACALAIAEGRPAPPAPSVAPAPSPQRTIGRPAEGGFLIDFRKGFDPQTQLLADWDMDAGWLVATFADENVRFDRNGMTLVSERRKTGKAPYTSAEFQREGFYGYGRYEVVMRAAKGHGVVSSFFTYTGEHLGDPHSEIDFEFLGKTPRQVHVNDFWKGEDDPADIDLWFDASEGEHLYAFEWMPDRIVWYVDGVKIREVTSQTSPIEIPRASSRVIANIWAANGPSAEWVGEADFNRAEAFYRCMSHVPMNKSGPQCSDSFKPPPRR